MNKKIISIILIVAMIAAYAITAGAVTYITYGDWLLEIESDTTYLIGGYHGTDTELSFPEKAEGKQIVGVSEDFHDNCESKLKSVTIPDSYKTISSFAFLGMTSIEFVNIPAGLKSLGSYAFSSCNSLKSIDFSTNTTISTIPTACFSGCSSLSSVTLPNSLTSISDYAFQNTAIKSIVIPQHVKSLGALSFSNCDSLEQIKLQSGLETIGEKSFYNDNALTSVFVPNSVNQIGNDAFAPMANQGGTLTIECFVDSFAAEYANENSLNYSTCAVIRGDTDFNGIINICDATYIQLFLANKYQLDTDEKTLNRVDVTNDKKINTDDATKIQLFLAGHIGSLN